MRGAWQKNSIFLIGYFKRLSHIVGRMACLILVDNPCRAGRTNETYAWYRSSRFNLTLLPPNEPQNVMVVALNFRWNFTLLHENSSCHHHAAAPALRSRMHVSGFALAVCYNSTDGISIDNCQFPGLPAWRC